MNLVADCELKADLDGSGLQLRPSWVPDWSVPSQYYNSIYGARACWRSPVEAFATDNK